MKEKTVKVSGREYQRQLQKRMEAMIEQANALRDEAAEKLYNVPKYYELITRREEARSLIEILGLFVGMLVCFVVFGFSIQHEWYGVTTVMLIVYCIAYVALVAQRSKPYDVTQHPDSYHINDVHYVRLEEELNRLKEGISDYNWQYAEQKEMIEQFRDLIPEIAARGGTLELVLKADNFHAHVELQNECRKINCDLDFSPENYSWLATGMYAFTELTAQPEPAS